MPSSEGYASEGLTIVWLMLITTVVVTYFLQSNRVTLLPPASSALLLGVFFGIASRIAGLAKPLRFSPAAFFYAFLPPIVFAAGFTLKKRAFFDNIFAILCFAVLGTFISALVFGFGTYTLYLFGIIRPSHLAGAPFLESMLYGAAISSIDPVSTLAVLAQTDAPPILYNLVFGESVLNDAVAIVLFRSLASYAKTGASVGFLTLPGVVLRFSWLAVGSLAVGVGVSLACAFLLKRFDAFYSSGAWAATTSSSGRTGPTPPAATDPHGSPAPPPAIDPPIYEIAIVVMGSYLAYLVAEVVGMSGIVALFFTGICHGHYSYWNVSKESRIALRRLFEVAAFLCELFVFAYLGLQVATMQHSFDFGLFFSGIPLAIASRFANIFPCSRLLNKYRATHKLPKRLQRMLWAVGLRGAVAYGLLVNMPRTDTPEEYGIPAIETAALLIVVVSTLVLGSATGPLLRHIDLEGRSDAEIYAEGWEEEALANGVLPGGGGAGIRPDMGDFTARSAFQDRFREFDETFLKPLFGGKRGGNTGMHAPGDASPFDGSELGEHDRDAPTLRRPLFGDNAYWFGGRDEQVSNGNGSRPDSRAGDNASRRQHHGGSSIPAAHHGLGSEGKSTRETKTVEPQADPGVDTARATQAVNDSSVIADGAEGNGATSFPSSQPRRPSAQHTDFIQFGEED